MTAKKKFFSLKFQVLIALAATLLVSFATFYFIARRIIVADKKLLVRDLNLALMDGAYGAVTKSIIMRGADIVQAIAINKVVANPKTSEVVELFSTFRPPFSSEIFRITFLKRQDNGSFAKYAEYKNWELVKEKGFKEGFFDTLDLANIEVNKRALQEKTIGMDSYSGNVGAADGAVPFYGLRLTVPARSFKDDNSEWLAQVDLDQTFLIHALKASDLTDTFLLGRKGNLISHSDPSLLLEPQAFHHPLLEKLEQLNQRSESVEVKMDDGEYIASIREAGFPDIYLISQIPEREIYQSMKQLLRSTTVSGLLILYLAFIGSIFFSTRITVNLKRLASAAKQIGSGNFDVRLAPEKKSAYTDEVGLLSHGFEVMAQEIQDLLVQTAEKSRMENELKTASLLQSTVLITPEVKSDDFRLANCYIPATECSGDFLDTFMVGRTLYFAVADATGHGAAAAIVTGVAKSCLLTLRNLHADQLPKPQDILSSLNRVIHGTCQGKLMMTMCLVQLNLDTGELIVANAGHEAPLCLRGGESEKKKKPEEFFVRGERLGFAPESEFSGEAFTLEAGDTLLLYTDGVSEAVNGEGAEWGERQLKKAFTKALTEAQTVDFARDSILRELRGYIGNEPPHDDVTFSLLQFTPSNVKKIAA